MSSHSTHVPCNLCVDGMQIKAIVATGVLCFFALFQSAAKPYGDGRESSRLSSFATEMRKDGFGAGRRSVANANGVKSNDNKKALTPRSSDAKQQFGQCVHACVFLVSPALLPCPCANVNASSLRQCCACFR